MEVEANVSNIAPKAHHRYSADRGAHRPNRLLVGELVFQLHLPSVSSAIATGANQAHGMSTPA